MWWYIFTYKNKIGRQVQVYQDQATFCPCALTSMGCGEMGDGRRQQIPLCATIALGINHCTQLFRWITASFTHSYLSTNIPDFCALYS